MNNMGRNRGDLGGRSGKMRLKKVRRRDDMSMVGEDYHTEVSASVPFKWESEPGTPKANLVENRALLSPLTPPPSYFSNHTNSPLPLTHIPSYKPNFLNSVFRKLSLKPTPHPPSPTSFSSSSPSSSSSTRPGTPRRLSFDSRVDDDDNDNDNDNYNYNDDHNVQSPVSTLFFARGSDKGCYPKLAKVFTRDSK